MAQNNCAAKQLCKFPALGPAHPRHTCLECGFHPHAPCSIQLCDVTSDTLTEYDKLSWKDFESVVLYISAVYRSVRNNKNQSGYHRHISNFCGGKAWVIYFHTVLEESGDMNFASCVYPELDPGIKRTSAGGYMPRRINRRKTTATERSLSPIPGMGSNLQSKKQDVIDATGAAASAIADRQDDLRHNNAFDRMMKLKRTASKLTLQYVQMGEEYKKAKRAQKTGKISQSSLNALKKRRSSVKASQKMYADEYETLKDSIGYKSPDVSDASSPSEDESDVSET